MNKLSAVKFRLVLCVAMVIMVALIVTVFVFGYQYLQTVGNETKKSQADAVASESSIGNLQRLQIELNSQSDVTKKLESLRSNNTLPQFDTEKSLRTIARQLGISVKGITFVDGGGSDSSTSSTGAVPAQGSAQTGSGSQSSGSSGSWGGSRNSRISFEFSNTISYVDFVRFLDAIETSTPKLRIDGVNIPSGSSRSSVDPGTLTLELATP